MKKFAVLLLFLFEVQILAVAQRPFIQPYYLGRKNELIQVNTLFQSKTGYVYIGATKGLYVSAGNAQHLFTPNDPSLRNVTALAEDSTGRIWAGYDNGHLNILDKTRRFSDFVSDEGTASKPVSDILFDRAGVLWYGTLNDGLYYHLKDRTYRIDEQEGLPDLYIYDLALDAAGNVWAGTDGGVAVCRLLGRKPSVTVIDHNDGLPDNIVKKIIPENANTVWLATEDAGVLSYDVSTRKITPLIPDWSYGTVSDIALRGNQVWIACAQRGLLVVDRATKAAKMYPSSSIKSLTSIRTLLNDREGNIWIGTKSALARIPGDNIEFIGIPRTDTGHEILAITPDTRGNLWFSSNDGLFRLSGSNLEQEKNMLAGTPYEKYKVISLYDDRLGHVWAGLYGEGVLCINDTTGKITLYQKELRNGNVLSITGHGKDTWLSTLGGITKITEDNARFTFRNFSVADGLVSDFIYQTLPEKDQVWYATDGKGLGMMDDSGYHHYDSGLVSKVIYGIARDGDGKLWVNVQGGGLYWFDGTQFHRPDSTLIFRDNDLHTLTTDKSGNIVVTHDEGIDVLDRRKNIVRYIGEESGLRDKTVSFNATGKDLAGNLYFGTSDGAVVYRGEFQTASPKAVIDVVKVFDEHLDLKNNRELRYDENNITVRFLGLWYQNPDGLLFQYKLENYDVEWITTTDRQVTYSRLPAGTYTFSVRASADEHFHEAPAASVTFTIRPPFWETGLFYVLVSLAVIFAVYAFIGYSSRKLRRDKERLESIVRLRTMEIQRQNDEIQAQNEEITAQSEEIQQINENLEAMVQDRTAELERKNKTLEEYAFINAHKLRSPVASILGLVNLFSKTKMDEEGQEINRRLKGSAEELDAIVSAIARAIEKGEKPPL